MKNSAVFLIITILLSITDLSAETTIPGGNVAGNWYKADSPYNVTGNITVPSGSTLTLEPGVQVIFSGSYSFNVNGFLIAVGTALDSIFFTAGISWNGLNFSNAPDSSKLVFCRISQSSWGGITCNNSNPVISHCTISNNGGVYGGIILNSSSPNISYCNIKNNVSFDMGGGIIMASSSSHISYSIISGNKSNSSGGGIWCSGTGTPLFAYCDIVGNQSGSGGGMYILQSNAALNNCTIDNNKALYGAGVAFFNVDQSTITDCIITANTSNSQGGGIFISSSVGTFIINNSTINNCKATFGGGVYIDQAASASITSCTFRSNLVDNICSGGALYINQAGTISVMSSILDDNFCGYNGNIIGGVIYSANCSNLLINNCDVLNNRAVVLESGIHINGNTSMTVKNSIFKNQMGPDIWHENYSSVLVSYNDFSGGNGFVNPPSGLGVITGVNANGDPCDVFLNIYMDPLFVDPENLDYHLTENSPCIDGGDTSLTDPDNTISDIGAFFFSQPPDVDFEADITQGEVPLTVHFTDNSIGELTDWSWDFGDGNTSTEPNPTNIYNIPGVYNVTLTITGI